MKRIKRKICCEMMEYNTEMACRHRRKNFEIDQTRKFVPKTDRR